MYRWTVDVEYDWGGRTNGIQGIERGLPKIVEAFREYSIHGLFFISTEIAETDFGFIKNLRNLGHEIGSHGHVHTKFKEEFRRQADKDLSISLLALHQSVPKDSIRYRAPKFNYEVSGERYSYRKSHVSLLKNMWFKEKIKEETIIYLHPFDIVETQEAAPSLFCKLWYSRPKKAYDTFINLLNHYPDSYIHEG